MSGYVQSLLRQKKNEGDPHRVMKAAFKMRLDQLFPDAVILKDRPVSSLPIRPDVYVRHKDGRRWAYEMVHGNTRHLLEKQAEYIERGVSAVWILWCELRPRAGRKYISPDQGILITNSTYKPRYRLNLPERQLLQMQLGPTRRLYAFTLNPFYTGKLTSLSEFMHTALIGVEIYEFENYTDGQSVSTATCEFFSLADLTFGAQGHPCGIAADDPVFEQVAKDMGFELSRGFLVAELLERVDRLLTTPEELRRAIILYIAYKLSEMPKLEQHEVMSYMTSGRLQQQLPLVQGISEAEVGQVWHDPKMIYKALPDIRRLSEALERMDAPETVKHFLQSVISTEQVTAVADFMHWEAKSLTLRRARGDIQPLTLEE